METSVPPPRATLDRLLLPVVSIKSSASSKQLEQRLNYLWTTAHALVATSPALAHVTAATILETARRQCVQLPPAVLDFLCQQCGGLLVPSVSAAVHVVPVTASAPANRKLARRQQKNRRSSGGSGPTPPRCERLQNVVQLVCHRCRFVNERHGASVVYKPKVKKPKKPKQKKKMMASKRPLDNTVLDPTASAPDAKRAKTNEEPAKAVDQAKAIEPAPPPVVAVAPAPPPQRSVFAKPPSPPRRLLDGKKKKKKPSANVAAATAEVKSSLDSFLHNLRK